MKTTKAIVRTGESLRCVGFPLGGIGTGNIALAGDGGLRQWQIWNTSNHDAHLPDSFFALHFRRHWAPPEALWLQSPARYDESYEPVPSVTDHVIPENARRLAEILPGIDSIEFLGEYPIARVRYRDDRLPLEVELEAFTPMAPLDVEISQIPAAIFRFRISNPTDVRYDVSVLGTLQNGVGYDGASPIDGVRCPRYGGNVNAVLRPKNAVVVFMTNPSLAERTPGRGSMALAALGDRVSARVAWEDVRELWNDFLLDGGLEEFGAGGVPGASPPGRTWNGAVATAATVPPGEARELVLLMTWHFPYRYANWNQNAFGIPDNRTHFFLGNAYVKPFGDALAVAEDVRDRLEELTRTTREYRDALHRSTLPAPVLEAVSSQSSLIRSPTCFRTEDERFWGFEGCCGASTGWAGAVGGCCPMNCTHVWNYEMALSRLYPELERSMRETELVDQLNPQKGYIPHRVVLPLYLPRPWERKIGGPDHPALDGMCGTVLKTWREHLRMTDDAWLREMMPRTKKLLEFLMRDFDPDGDGVIDGEQPNTYDVHVYGPNTFIGSLWLAALRAGEEMAKRVGDDALAEACRARFEKGFENYDRICWNGEYYIQVFDRAEETPHQWGRGCHSDQLLGQWWAHVLGLGRVLPAEHVRGALEAIRRHNFRRDLSDHEHRQRVFACGNEAGLLNCTWPEGGRPKQPIPYCDEVWTGIEYAVAALMIYEGMREEALEIVEAVRSRHDGRRRNPWNEIECGDHYARAMSSWSLLDAAAGYHFDGPAGVLEVGPRFGSGAFQGFLVLAEGWGIFRRETGRDRAETTVELRSGRLRLREFRIRRARARRRFAVSGVTVGGKAVRPRITEEAGDVLVLRWPRPVSITPDRPLAVVLKRPGA